MTGTESMNSPEPQIITPEAVPQGQGRRLLLVVAHADDAAISAGGILAMFSDSGWEIHALRVTDDRWDSIGLDEKETIRRNADEFREACKILGIARTEDLGWATDVLGDASRVALRERVIHAIRRVKPYALMTFDPDSHSHEDNLDHKVLAEAVDEAFWTAMFDKHHPEHFDEGFAPHGTVDRWFFGRFPGKVTHIFDTGRVLERQMRAVRCHATPIANMARQRVLQARTAVLENSAVAQIVDDPVEWFVRKLKSAARTKGLPYGLDAAEHMRLHSGGFGDV